ncbi:hypothetical protein ABW20_dc0106362 [Dactylellina cionopaga]|nr:hypothetical protein ABW20_dc0106362 [Dactylellina cionopaga]
MYFGKAISSEHIRLADLKVRNKDHPLILLENFDDLTESIICTGKDQEITLKFKSKDGLNSAIVAWDWVNDNETDYFFLITHHHHKGCGPDEERAPYKITDVEYDEANLKAILTKESASWDETLRTFEMSINTVDHPLQRRSISTPFGDVDLTAPYKFAAGKVCDGGSQCTSILSKLITPPILTIAQETGERIESTVNLAKDGYNLFFGDGIKRELDINWGNSDPNNKQQIKQLFKGPGGVDFEGTGSCTGCYLQGHVDINIQLARKTENVLPSILANFVSTLKGRMALEIEGKISKEKDINLIALLGNTALLPQRISRIFKFVPEVMGGPGFIIKGELSSKLELPSVDINLPDYNFQMDFGFEQAPSFVAQTWPENAITMAEVKSNGIDWSVETDMYWRIGYGMGVEFFSKDPLPVSTDLLPGTKVGVWGGLEPRIDLPFKGRPCEAEAAENSVNAVVNTDLITVTPEVKLNVKLRPMLELHLGDMFEEGFVNGNIELAFKDIFGGDDGNLLDGCTLGSAKLGERSVVDRCNASAPLLSGPEPWKWTDLNTVKECAEPIWGKYPDPTELCEALMPPINFLVASCDAQK